MHAPIYSDSDASWTSAIMQNFGAQVIFPSTAAAGFPVAIHGANSACTGAAGQLRQSLDQNHLPARRIVGRSERAADGMIDKNGAWRRDFRHDIQRRADDERGNPGSFDDMGNKTDGLVAKRSIRD
jgi:hypothetical protein